MRMVVTGVGLLLSIALTACSSEVADAANADPSKLSDELEKRAEQIEQKADMAVAAAEREAATELESLRAEAADGEEAGPPRTSEDTRTETN